MHSKRVLWSLLWFVVFEKHQIEGPENTSSEKASSSSSWFNPRNPPPSSSQLFDEGRQYRRENNNIAALECFNEVIIRDSTELQYYRERASCNWDLGHKQAAIDDLQHVVNKNPENKYDRLALSRALLDDKQYSDALKVMLVLDDTDELATFAVKLFERGRYIEALQCYNEVISRSSNDPRFYKLRAECYLEMKNFNMALSDLRMMVRIEPENKSHKLLLSRVLYNLGEFQECIQETIALNDNFYLSMLGDKFFSSGKYNEAIGCYTYLIERNPENALYYKTRAYCHSKMKNNDDAVRDIEIAAKIDPSNEEYRSLLRLFNEAKERELDEQARTLFRKRKYEEAVRCYTEAINKNPSEKRYYKRRARCNSEIKDWDMTISDLRRLVVLDPSDKDSIVLLGHALVDSGKFYQFEEDTLSILNDTQLEVLGNSLVEKKEYEEALHCYTAALRKNPRSSYFRRRGNCYSFMKNSKMALLEFMKAVRAGPTNEVNRIFLTEAIFDSETFWDVSDNDLNLLTKDELETLGDRFFNSSKFGEALRCYNEAINKEPTEARFYQRRGRCYAGMGEPFLAIAEYQKAVQVNSNDTSIRSAFTEALYECERFNELPDETLNILNVNEIETLGIKFSSERKLEEALRCYAEAIKRRPNEAKYFWRRGMCYSDMLNYGAAIFEYQNAIRLNPHDEVIRSALTETLYKYEKLDEIPEETLSFLTDVEFFSLGIQFMIDGKLQEAARCFTEAIKKNPAPNYFRRRGNCYKDMGNEYMAISDYERAVQLSPRDRSSRIALMDALRQCEQFRAVPEETLNHLTESELESMADEFFAEKRFEDALRCYSKAIERDPFKLEYYQQRGKCYWKMKEGNAAVAEFRSLVLMDPTQRENIVNLRAVLFEFERYDELIEETLHMDEYEVSELGSRFFSLERYSEALRCYTEALRRNPHEAMSYGMRGFCHWRMGNLEAAAVDMMESVRLDPSNSGFLVELSQVLVEADKLEEARNVLANVIDTSEWNQDAKKLEAARKKVEDLIEIRRLNEQVVYFEKLLLEDKERRISEAAAASAMYSAVSTHRISEIELSSEYYVDALKLSFAQYNLRMVSAAHKLDGAELFDEPEFLLDKINCELMTNPVITPSGITYEKSEIMKHLQWHYTDPMTRQNLEVHDLIPNHAVKEAIQLWKKENNR